MEARKEHYIKKINEVLVQLEYNLRINGKNHYFDLHSGAEDAICGLMNVVFGFDLVNLNNKHVNYPGIDLADQNRKLAVQVTSDGSRNKIRSTLGLFEKEKLYKSYDKLIIMILGNKPRYRKPFNASGVELTIMSLEDIAQIVSEKNVVEIEKIAHYLQNAFVFRSCDELQKQKSTVVNKKNLWNQLPVIQQHYINRFRNKMVDREHKNLSLEDLYVANPYILGESTEWRDDLLLLIEHFVRGDLTEWPAINNAYEEFNTLVVKGQRCTGKSTLIAKILTLVYSQWGLPQEKVHLLCLGDQEWRDSELSVRKIREQLELESNNQLCDALLIIDAFDEADWPSQEARSQLENLISDLTKYRCKLIVMTRQNYLDTADFEEILNITLCPFSLNHAERWLDIYGTSDTSVCIEKIINDIRTVPDDTQRVILLPHVLQLCVSRGIELGSVLDLNQLYDMVFRGQEGLFLKEQHFPSKEAQRRKFQQMLDTAVKISICCMKQNNLISVRELNALISVGGPQMERMKTEYLLERRDKDSYAFIHKTIPSYLIALSLYEAFSTAEDEMTDQLLLTRIAPLVTTGGILSSDVIQSLEQMSRREVPAPGERAERLLHLFLMDELESDELCVSGQYCHAEKHYEMWFEALVRLVFALKAAWRNESGEYCFFEKLNPAERRRFCLFFNHNKEYNKSWDLIRHSVMDNCSLPSLDYGKTVLQSKVIRAMVMTGAIFEGANLRGAYILDSDMSAARFDEANCSCLQVSNSILCSASFHKTRLRGALFTGCNLSNADFRDADLNKVRFENCNIYGVKINAQQLHDCYSLFDLDTILQNKVRLYVEDCELPEDLAADEYRKQRPVYHSIQSNKAVFVGGNTPKAERICKVIQNHSGAISIVEIMEACPAVSLSTIRRVLRRLLQNNQISTIGSGRNAAYMWTAK